MRGREREKERNEKHLAVAVVQLDHGVGEVLGDGDQQRNADPLVLERLQLRF